MTSGEFQSYPVDSIVIIRDERQRKEITGIEELANSISRNGLIHPIVIQRDGVLVAGERRLTAVRQLGWTNIMVQFVDELEPWQLREIELEENIRRIDLDWRDECLAVEEYHRLKTDNTKNWRAENTAENLHLSPTSIRERLRIAKALKEDDKRIVEAPRYSTAKSILERRTQRAISTLEIIEPEKIEEGKTVPIINTTFEQWLDAYEGRPKFNFIHCDFPYGVNADAHVQGAAAAMGGYDDSADVYWGLVQTLAKAMDKVVAESAHIMFWFSMDYYNETIQALRQMGWVVNHFPLIWHKSDNTGIIPDHRRGPRRTYETALIGSRGDRFIVSPVGNSFPCSVTKDIHMSEKNVLMLRHFFRLFVDEYTIMLDPTCGSANALKAAEMLSAKEVLGLEKDEEFYTRAKEAYHND